MKAISLALFLLLQSSALYAKPKPCALDESVMEGYGASATLEQSRLSRLALYNFIGCDPLRIDGESRKIFFRAIKAEFEFDHTAEFRAWRKNHPGSDALWEGINSQQNEMRDYLDRIFDPHRDREFQPIVLRYGKASTIARLGPEAKEGVRQTIAVGSHFYGLSGEYNSQVDALEALGEWIDPANGAFGRREKAEFAQLLSGLLDVSDVIRGDHHRRLLRTVLEGLGRSDDQQALASVEKWASRHRHAQDELVTLAADTAAKMKKRMAAKR